MAGAQGSLPRGWGTSKAGDSLASLGSPVPCPITLLDEVSTVGMVRGGSVSTPPAEANGAGAARTESMFYSGEYWDLAGAVLVATPPQKLARHCGVRTRLSYSVESCS